MKKHICKICGNKIICNNKENIAKAIKEHLKIITKKHTRSAIGVGYPQYSDELFGDDYETEY